MPTTKFYPPVSDLISLEQIPEKLGFLKDGINSLMGNIHYKNFYQDISRYGDRGLISITIVPYQSFGFPILGTGMELILNPGSEPGTSEFPISLAYEWGIIQYLRGFKLASFQGDAQSLFDLLLQLFAPDSDKLLDSAIALFIQATTDPIQTFVDDFNNSGKYTPNTLVHPQAATDADNIADLLVQINGFGLSPITIIYEDYVEKVYDSSLTPAEAFKENVKNLFSFAIGLFHFPNFEKMLIPQASAALNNIDIGLTFPTNYVRQVDPVTFEPLQDVGGDDIPSMLVFNVGRMRFSTENGFEFEGENSFTFPTSEIGKTGLIINIQGVKADLSRTKNIPEANADYFLNEQNLFFGFFCYKKTNVKVSK